MVSINDSINDYDEELIDRDIEIEEDDPSIDIDRPFDPEKIKVRTIPIVVELLVSRIKHREIDLSPDFQRLRGVWENSRKSRLIESLLLRIPIPVFYVAEDENENWAVVDGLQRISTIYDFITGKFELTDLEYLTRFNGRLFTQLPRPMQRRINETQFVINVIEQGTPEEVMFNIFSRINTGGLRLNGQEIRHALHKGPVREFLRKLANTDEFVKATAGSVKKRRMADRECALRFLAFYIDPWENYSSNDLDGFLGRAMKTINGMSHESMHELRAAFQRSMKAAYELFDDDAFRKRYDENDGRRRPISKALFEAWAVQLARLKPPQIHKLVARRLEVRSAFIRLMNEDRDFETAISYSTGVPQRVMKRFGAIQQLIMEFV